MTYHLTNSAIMEAAGIIMKTEFSKLPPLLASRLSIVQDESHFDDIIRMSLVYRNDSDKKILKTVSINRWDLIFSDKGTSQTVIDMIVILLRNSLPSNIQIQQMLLLENEPNEEEKRDKYKTYRNENGTVSVYDHKNRRWIDRD